MGVRSTRYVLSGLAVLAGAGAAPAAVKTQLVSSGKVSALVPYALPLFDPKLGTLLKVDAAVDFEAATGFTYMGFAAPGFDPKVSGSASFGNLSFDLAGQAQTSEVGNGRGAFSVSALGSGSWSGATDLARFTGSTTGQVTTTLFAPTPGTGMTGGSGPTVTYKVTYTYDDGTPAVPEPASWAMMAGGFVLVGVALRTARRRPAAAASEAPTAS